MSKPKPSTTNPQVDTTLDLANKPMWLLLLVTALGSISLVESVIGISFQNVHILRDFFNVVLLVACLSFSIKSIQIWSEKVKFGHKDSEYTFGYHRFCLLATFFNCVYLLFTSVFDWMETIHHFIEYLEHGAQKSISIKSFNSKTHMVNADLHSGHSSVPSNFTSAEELSAHLDEQHLVHNKETNLFVAIFALIRLLLCVAYLFSELHNTYLPFFKYMIETWFGWPKVYN